MPTLTWPFVIEIKRNISSSNSENPSVSERPNSENGDTTAVSGARYVHVLSRPFVSPSVAGTISIMPEARKNRGKISNRRRLTLKSGSRMGARSRGGQNRSGRRGISGGLEILTHINEGADLGLVRSAGVLILRTRTGVRPRPFATGRLTGSGPPGPFLCLLPTQGRYYPPHESSRGRPSCEEAVMDDTEADRLREADAAVDKAVADFISKIETMSGRWDAVAPGSTSLRVCCWRCVEEMTRLIR